MNQADDGDEVVLRGAPDLKVAHLAARPAENNRPPAINRDGLLCLIFTWRRTDHIALDGSQTTAATTSLCA
jgi:hypothetical protein